MISYTHCLNVICFRIYFTVNRYITNVIINRHKRAKRSLDVKLPDVENDNNR